MNKHLEHVRDVADAAGASLAELRELRTTADKQAIGTLAALGTPFGVEEAVPGMPFDSTDPILAATCSRYCDRADDCIVQD